MDIRHEHLFKIGMMKINGPRETANIKHMQLQCDCGFMLWAHINTDSNTQRTTLCQ